MRAAGKSICTVPADRTGVVSGALRADSRNTVPGLDLPYGGQENTQEKLATASVELQQMGFALQELALYLDTHAQDDEAAQLFNQYVEMYQQAIEQYQQGNGPLTLMDAAAGGTYDWLSGPWPWEYGKER